MVLAGIVLTAGCAGRYQITLNSGHQITTRGKPRLNRDTQVYEYKSLKGERAYVPALRVKAVEPIYRFDKPEEPPHPLPDVR